MTIADVVCVVAITLAAVFVLLYAYGRHIEKSPQFRQQSIDRHREQIKQERRAEQALRDAGLDPKRHLKSI
jgi:uncharacterized ion transporter superfamily protein YfcC